MEIATPLYDSKSGTPTDETIAGDRSPTVLVIFGGITMYGMERGVIEIFDLVRSEVEPSFLISRTPRRLGLPLFDEIERRKFHYSFFSDHDGWERVGKPRSFAHFWRILFALWRGNIDALQAVRRHEILYIPNLMSALYAGAAIFYCRVAGRRVVYHFHDLQTAGQSLLSLVSILVTDFVHNTKLGYDRVLASNSRLRKKRNHIIPYPMRSLTSAVESPAVLPRANGKRSILFVGQVSQHKGIDILLDAFAVLARSHENLVLNIVGGCDDPLLRQRIENVTTGNACEVKWWGYQEDIGQFLREAYVYVHPSPPSRFHESFGIGLVEAMSLGIPSVCFRSGAFEEIMIHEETGLLCEEERPQALAESIDRLLSDVDLRDYCGRQALKHYRENYSSVQIKARWLNALRNN
jgi:glycosyltransferase involved in cell wall biosynthesis